MSVLTKSAYPKNTDVNHTTRKHLETINKLATIEDYSGLLLTLYASMCPAVFRPRARYAILEKVKKDHQEVSLQFVKFLR